MKGYRCLAAALALGIPLTVWARMSPKEIYKTQAEAVVLIVAAPEGSSSASAGTGSIIDSRGTVVTNCHVIYDEGTKKPFPAIHVFLKPPRVTGDMNKDLSRHYNASVIAFDRDLDLALLKIENPPSGLKYVTLGDPEDVGPGDETIAIGHPEQGGLWTITTGVIGSEFENFKGIPGKHVFQMETDLNRGNSGGPLFDVRGYQIGVNTAIARQGQGGVAITGVNFALKASVVKNFAAKHNIMLAYGTEKIEEQPVQVAEAPKARPAAEPPQPVVKTPEGDSKTITAPGGYIKIEEEETSSKVARPQTVKTPEAKPAAAPAKREPVKFEKHYRTKARPYTFKKLFTAVDKVRANAEEAFDDLEREVQRRQNR